MEYKGKVYAKINGKYLCCTESVNDLESAIKSGEKKILKLNELTSKLTSDNIYYHTLFNCLLDEINENQMRAVSMINAPDLDLSTIRFYEGQLIVLERILKSIDYE